jgi:hypothetical protein
VPRSDKPGQQPETSRLQRMRRTRGDEGYTPSMPPAGAAAYLLDYLFEVGPTMAAGAGEAELSHQEIESWARLRRIELTPWEARTLRRLSRDYLAEKHAAEDPRARAPWTSQNPEDLAHVAVDLRGAIAGLTRL